MCPKMTHIILQIGVNEAISVNIQVSRSRMQTQKQYKTIKQYSFK